MGLAQGSSFVLQFAASIIIARYLTPYETGIYAASVAITALLSMFQALGLQALVVREERLTTAILATVFTVNALASVLISLCILIAAVVGGAFLDDAGVQKVLWVLAAGPLLGIFTCLPAAHLQRSGRFKEIALVSLTCNIIAALLTILLVLRGYSYMSMTYAQLASGVSYAVLINIAGRQHVSFRVSLSAWRRIGEFGIQILATAGVSSASERVSDILVARLLGLIDLGIYNRAKALTNLLFVNVNLTMGSVIFSKFASLHRQDVSLRHRYLTTLEVMTAALWPAFAGLAVVAEPLIFRVYGPQWIPAATPLVLLVLASMIQVAISMTWELFTATGRLPVQTRIEFIRSGLALLMFGIGCMISLNAAAATRIFDAFFAFLLYRPHVNSMTATTMSDLWPIYMRSGLLTCLAIGPSLLLMVSSDHFVTVPVLYLIVSITAGISLWIGGLFFLKHPLALELRGLAARLQASRQ